jgi:N-formylglutamate deformylase
MVQEVFSSIACLYVPKMIPMTPIPYYLYRPNRQTTAVVFSSPHSGRDYPEAFLQGSLLDKLALRSSEDAYIDDLFGLAPDFGAPLLVASAPRAFVDLNRSMDDLDPAAIKGVSRRPPNARVASGLGVIPRVVSEGRTIRSGKMSYSEAIERLDQYYRPYHAQLRQLLKDTRQDFGAALLVDCHSMPSEALDTTRVRGVPRPQVVLGDRFGATCDKQTVDQVEAAFRSQGFTVMRNTPFAGAFITQNYGRPAAHQQAIQVEIDRSLYMDEATVTPNAEYEAVKQRLTGVLKQICSFASPSARLAAE